MNAPATMTTRDAVLAELVRIRDWATVSAIMFRDQLDRAEVVAALRQMAVEGRVARQIYQEEAIVERWRAIT